MKANKVLFITQEITPYLPESEIATICRNLPQGIQGAGTGGLAGGNLQSAAGGGGGIWYPFPAADSSLDPDDPAAAGTVNRLSRPL